MKRNFLAGDITKFKKIVDRACTRGSSFKTISTGMSRKITYPTGNTFKFFGQSGKSDLIDGAFLVQMVMREIDAYVEQNGIPQYEPNYEVQMFNLTSISKLAKNKKPCVGIDINACYWTTAYNLGYISEKLYKRGIEAAKKKGLLVAIGCLNKLPIIRYYEDGKLKKRDFDWPYHNKYSPFYWNIIKHTYDVLMRSFAQFGDNWYMYLTDCLFVDLSQMNKAQKFFSELGYSTKIHYIHFEKFDGRKITWFDHKEDKNKSIYAGMRDVTAHYPKWQAKQSKGQLAQPLTYNNNDRNNNNNDEIYNTDNKV